MRKTTCKDHTECPADYIGWHAWAEKKSRRHYQERCDECGLFNIWRRKPKAMADDLDMVAADKDVGHTDNWPDAN